MCKNDSSDVIIVHFQVSTVIENAFCHYATCLDSNRGQLYVIRYIAYSIDSWDICVLVFVHFDSPILFKLNTYLGEIHAICVRYSTDSNETLL